MSKKDYRWTKPICRCLNCKYNKHDVCINKMPGKMFGWRCQDFISSDTKASTDQQ